MMKVLHYTTSLSRSGGGLFTAVSGLAKAQKALGADVYVAGWLDKDFEEDKSTWGDVSIIGFATNRIGYGLNLSVFKAILRIKPQIFHVHGIWSAASIYGIFAALMGIKVVVSPHGMLDPWILARSKLKKFVHYNFLEKPLLRFSKVHALNENELNAVLTFYPLVKKNSFVIPNGIECNCIESTSKKDCIFIGRLHEKKQVVQLIEHWPCDKQYPRLTIAGWGEEDYTHQVINAVQKNNNVEFLGSLYGKDKEERLASAQFIILPSLSEGLPMAILEGLAYGAVPIITKECNLDILFDHGVAVEIKSDFSDFFSMLSSLTTRTEEELINYSNSCKDFAKRYEWKVVAKEMLDQYQKHLV